jgi:hypothetical protein
MRDNKENQIENTLNTQNTPNSGIPVVKQPMKAVAMHQVLSELARKKPRSRAFESPRKVYLSKK